MRLPASFQPTKVSTLLRKILILAARLRRVLNGRVAAVMTHHDRVAGLFARRKLNQRRLDKTRISCGPIDQFRQRRGIASARPETELNEALQRLILKPKELGSRLRCKQLLRSHPLQREEKP